MNPIVELRLSKTSPVRLQYAIEASSAKTSVHPDVRNEESPHVQVREAQGQHFLGVGLNNLHRVEIDGSVGDYAFCGAHQCEITLEGSAGDYLAHSFRSGVLIVTGNAGHSVGAMGTGGLITVYGSAKDRVGVSLRGADVLIRGNAGADVAQGMTSGTIIIGGTAGENMGQGMTGGTIFLRGDATEISSDIEEFRLREPDRLKLGLLLLKAGIKSTAGKEFRVFRPKVNA